MTMTVNVSIAKGLGYCIGQNLYFGGQYYKIDAKYPVYENGRLTSYNVILRK